MSFISVSCADDSEFTKNHSKLKLLTSIISVVLDSKSALELFDEYFEKSKQLKDASLIKPLKERLHSYIENTATDENDEIDDLFKKDMILAFLQPILSTQNDSYTRPDGRHI